MTRGGARSKGSRRPGEEEGAADSAPEVKDKIRVVVRLRPMNSTEASGNSREVVRVVGDQMLVFDPREEETPEYFHGKARRQRDINKRQARDVKFVFDHVFDGGSRTMDVFENTTKKILDGLMDGYNCSVFAYGATGAGKTHTMLGSQDNPGVIFLTMMDLYQRIEQMKDTKTCDIAVSYLEVYNEQIRDLLMPGGYLPVREDPNRGVTVTGLSLHKPMTADELMHMLRMGNSNRTQHPTDANAESSRSHAVFQVFVKQRDRTANTSTDWRVAKMSLIDLAGSERATVTKNRGQRFREGANINRSLLALGNCINALAEGKSKGYVPYRNSKLTRLLKDSLGGNCRTVMIAAVSPSSMSFEDTYNTLKYADRAKNIKVGLKRNVMCVDLHVSRYVQVIEDLRKEVNELKVKLRTTENGTIIAGQYSPDMTSRATYERLSTSLESIFKARIEIRKEMLELEASSRDIQYKLYRKQLLLTRIKIIAPNEKEASQGLQRGIEGAKRRQRNIKNQRQAQETKLADNVAWLRQVEEEMKISRPNNAMAEQLDQNLGIHHLQVELRDQRRQAKYLKRLCRQQEREAQTMEKFIAQLLQTIYNQYMLIKGHNLASYKEHEQFETVVQMTRQTNERSVVWADQNLGPGVEPVTPGPGVTLQGEELDIASLLDFPIMSAVPISPPKTPHSKANNSKVQTPNNRNQQAVGTPSSARRRRRTPRRTPGSARRAGKSSIPTPHRQNSNEEIGADPAQRLFSAGGDSSPSSEVTPPNPPCALESGSHVVNTTYTAMDGVFPLQPSPVGTQSISRVAPVGQEQGYASLPQQQSFPYQMPPNAVPTLPPSVQMQATPAPPVSLPVPDGAHGRLHCPPQQTQVAQMHGLQVPHQQPYQTLNGAQSIPHDQYPSLPSDSAFVDSTIMLGPTITARLKDTNTSVSTLDSTVVISSSAAECLMTAGGFPLPTVLSSPPQMARNDDSADSILQTPVLNSQPESSSGLLGKNTVTKPTNFGETVTKNGLPSAKAGNTVTKLVHGSATITKSRPANDENADITPSTGTVVRSMDFGPAVCGTPNGRISFADAVRSPAPMQVQHLQQAQPVRSPLASRDNLPFNNVHRQNLASALTGNKAFFKSKDTKRMLSQPLKDNPNARRHTVHHNKRVVEANETLRKFGIPSMLDKGSTNVKRGGPGTPSYMKNTKASTRRNKNHRRSITSDDGYIGVPRRKNFMHDENEAPGPRRTIIQSWTKSTASLGNRKGFN